MSSTGLENTLRDLPNLGTLVKDRGYRQVWRFEHEGKAYFLKFYPRTGARDQFRRFFRGSPALAEFTKLQALQRAKIPAARARNLMIGFNVADRTGDAVILDAIEPSIPLDQYLMSFEQVGTPVPNRRDLVGQVCDIVYQLGSAKLGHEDLHLGNFLLHDGKLFLLDGYAVRTNGMKLSDLLMLGHSVRRFATTTDLMRGWNQLGPGGMIPTKNPVGDKIWSRFLQGVTRDNRYFGKVTAGEYSGIYYKRTKQPVRWATSSRLEITAAEWQSTWPELLKQIDADTLPVIKRSRSGDVLRATITLAGQSIDVIVKRPRKKYWYRYVNEIGRGSRAMRGWKKAWNLIVRDIPTAWPLVVMERRSAGYVTDAFLICETVPGETLAHQDLAAITTSQRGNLLRRTGHLLRAIERFGFSHFDAKASNWIAFPDPVIGPTPVLIDVDGIRRRNWVALGIQRLLRSMRENKTYGRSDSYSLCRGYAPYARLGEIAIEPA